MKKHSEFQLGDIATFIRGINFKPDDVVKLDVPNAVACMRTKNVQSVLDLSDVWAVDRRFVKRDEQFLRDGDILVSSANSWNLVGKCCYIDNIPYVSSFGGFVSVIRPTSEKIIPRFLYHWFASDIIQTKVRSFGRQTTNISNLDLTRCLELPLSLPSHDEQRRIAAILDKADAIRRKRQQSLKLTGDLVKSQFIEMFGDPVTNPMGWDVGTIRDIASDVRYGTSKPAADNGQYPYLRMNNITYEGQLDLASLKFIDVPDGEVEKYVARRGDVLFNRTNSKELVGKTCVFNQDTPMIIAGYIIRVRVNQRATPIYLSAILNSDYGKAVLRSMCKSIIGQANINAQELQDIKILIPPITLQNKFAAFVEQADKSKLAMQNQLSEIEIFSSALKQKFFA